MGFGQWTAYLIVAMKEIELLALRISRLETLENPVGRGHDHDGGDGALIPEAGLHADVIAQLVTNGDTHDHVGGDGDPIVGIVTGGDSHDHDGGDGAAIDTNALANLAVTAAKLATAVQNELVTNGDSHNHIGGDGDPIDTDALVSKAVTQAKIDDLAVDTGQLAAKAVTSAKIDDLAVDTGQIASNAITNAKMDNLAVDTAELANSAVETTKINNSAVNSDKIADNAISDQHIGDRVPMLTRRKGGSSSNWNTDGGTTYTPATVKMAVGTSQITISDGNTFNDGTFSFPFSFGGGPVVVATLYTTGSAWVRVESITTSSVKFLIWRPGSSGSANFDILWFAIGPE